MNDEDNSLINNSVEETPLYERPGVLDPDRNIPINRKSDEYANVHYDNENKVISKIRIRRSLRKIL